MCRLKIIGELAKSGYTKFEYEGNFLHSSLKYHTATFRNLENELKIYSFENESGNSFYMWSFIYEQITNGLNWKLLSESKYFTYIVKYSTLLLSGKATY